MIVCLYVFYSNVDVVCIEFVTSINVVTCFTLFGIRFLNLEIQILLIIRL